MRIYWYYPSPHLRAHPWPLATKRPGDEVTVQSLVPPDGVVAEPVQGYELRRELPRPPATHRAKYPRWWVSRARTYWRRARLREDAVRRGEFDLCHIHHINRATDWWAIGRLRRHLPVVLSVHDVLPHVRRLPQRIEGGWLHRSYEAADALVVYHQALREELLSRFRIDPGKVFVIPHPIRTSTDVRAPAERSRTVLFFGKLRPNKGINVLLEAIDLLPRDLDVKFVFAGRGDPTLEQRIRDAAAHDSRIDHEITWVSHQRRDELMQAASLIVLPYTDFYSQSGVLADAYTFGRPLVVTDVGALGSTVTNDHSGWVVAPREPAALARALEGALKDEEGREAAGEAAAKAGRARSYDVVGRQLRAAYDEVISRWSDV